MRMEINEKIISNSVEGRIKDISNSVEDIDRVSESAGGKEDKAEFLRCRGERMIRQSF